MPPRNRVILGLNAYSHDAGAALLVDGELVFAAEEERYDRVKHSAAFPRGAIRAALRHAGLEPGDVDAIAFPWRRSMARPRKAAYVLARLPRTLPFLTQRPPGLPPRRTYLRQVAGLPRDLRDAGLRAPLRWIEHHRAHAEQAWRFGPADEAALLTADGMGEWTATATWKKAKDGDAFRLGRQRFPHSLGKFYAAVTQYLGFRPDSGEGKTMGLAPYGRPRFVAAMRELLFPDWRRMYRVRLGAFGYPFGRTRMWGDAFVRRFGPPRAPDGPIEPHHEDVAFAAQAVLEEVVLDAARHLRLEADCPRLGLAGGVFLNCVLNARLRRDAGFDGVFAFPAAGDAGAAAGAAALVAEAPRRALPHAYWGDTFDDGAVARALRDTPHRLVDDPAAAAAAALARGRTVGWFQGRMEFGPRALGARSILADPRDPGIRDRLNRRVKFREGFRPFAPAVLLEEAADWFEDAAASPFMLDAFRARPGRAGRIPGVVHVDGTARVQTVAPDHPLPAFRRTLERFFSATGVPVVLNTSFNVRDEPIVRTPEEAAACFAKTGLDVLVMGRAVAEKPYPAAGP